jgi:hypothetical protein
LQRRWFFVPIGLFGVALIARVLLVGWYFPDGAVPIGPDAEDWVVSVAGIVQGDWTTLQANRYPLVPWGASILARGLGLSASSALLAVCVVASALVVPLVWWIGCRYLSPTAACVAAVWLALAPSQLLLGVSTIAYPVFGLLFAVVFAGFLDPKPARGAGLAGVAAFAGAMTLTQGLLVLLVLSPSALLLRRWWAFATSLLGALAGVWVVRMVHPGPDDPLRWMLTESYTYLSGNIAEETARAGGAYSLTFSDWAQQGFFVPMASMLLFFCLVLWGLASRFRETEVAALGWASAPALALVVAMGSTHHLFHLIPLLVVAAAIGASALPGLGRWRSWGGGVVSVVFIATAGLGMSDAMVDLRHRGENGQRELKLATEIVGLLGEAGVLIIPPTRPGHPAERVLNMIWAFPAPFDVVVLDRHRHDPVSRLQKLEEASGLLGWVGPASEAQWSFQGFTFSASGPSLNLPPDRHAEPQAVHQVQLLSPLPEDRAPPPQ